MASVAKLSLALAAARADDLLKETLQQRLDKVIELVKDPNLTISFAWKDADREVAVASGSSFMNQQPTTVEDTFLYGSGTKPLTAAAVMRMIDAGLVKAEDKAHVYIDPYLARHGKLSLASIFGEEVHESTVLGLVNMSAGIRDFEANSAFDAEVLRTGDRWWDYPFAAMNWSVSEENIKSDGGSGPLECAPGTCVAYSSTSYELAGLLLAAVLQPEKPWYDFDLASAVFEDRSAVPSMVFPPLGNGSNARLSAYLTVPGSSDSKSWGKAVIYEQEPSVLGWTCGNMVAAPRDVARFFYALLHPGAEDQLVSDASRAQMSSLRKTTAGWLQGNLMYGVGLMAQSVGGGTSWKPGPHIDGLGHAGDTYGFKSTNGYFPELQGSYSLSVNSDGQAGSYAQYYGMCFMIESIKRHVSKNESFSLHCPGSADIGEGIVEDIVV